LTILTICGLYFGLRLSYGFFTPYNSLTAKQDIKSGQVRIIAIGLPYMPQVRQRLAKQYGFEYNFVGCTATTELLNGSRYYNEVVEKYLTDKFGQDFWTKFNAQLDSIEIEKKELQTIIDTNIDQIIFGVYCGECGNHCATMYRYSMDGNQNSFSVDLTDSYFKNKSEITFNSYLNDQFHFDIGHEIVSNIPNTLLTSNKPSERFGCPDCTDGCGIFFEITKNSKRQKFYIDNQTSELTGDIKNFAEFLKTKINQLEKKNGL